MRVTRALRITPARKEAKMAARQRINRSLLGFLLIVMISSMLFQASLAFADGSPVYGYPTNPYNIISGSSAYGAFSDKDYQHKHTGVDVDVTKGDPVYSVCNGTIVWFGGWPWEGKGSWGTTSWLKCDGEDTWFGYAHLDANATHSALNASVKLGDRIALVGSITDNGEGDRDHLHFMKTNTDPTAITSSNLRWIFVDPTVGLGKTPDQSNGSSSTTEAPTLTIIDQTAEGLAAFGRTSCDKRSSTEWIAWHQIVNSNGEGYWDGQKLAEFFHSQRGWNASGYAFLLDSKEQANGTVKIWQLWPIDCISYGIGENYNTAGIHIAYVDVPAEAPPNPAQLRTLELLTLKLMADYHIAPDHVVSHKETALKERGGLGWTDAMMQKWYTMNDNKGVPHAWKPEKREIPAACDNLNDANCVDILNNPHADPVGLDMDAERAKLAGGTAPIGVTSDTTVTTTVEKTVVAEINDFADSGGYIITAHLANGAHVVATGDNTDKPLVQHFGEMGEGAYCVANGSYWEPNKKLTFSYIKDGKLVTKGEKLAGSFATRALYLTSSTAEVSSTIKTSFEGDMIVGLVPDESNLDNRGTTLVGVNGTDVYIVVVKGTVAQAMKELTDRGVSKDNVVMLDGGGSSQLSCTGKDLIKSDRPIPQGIGVVVPPESITPVENYDPRPAKQPFATDSTQPLAPMWMDSPSVWYWRSNIYEWAKKWNINPNIIATLMEIESCGLPTAVSRSGARGLFQVMPQYHLNAGETADQLFDPNFDADKGMKFYNSCLDNAGGDPRKAAACYNGGASVLKTSEGYWPSETQSYAKWFAMASDAFTASTHSDTLTTHVTGGSKPGGLCARASEWEAAHPREDNSIGGVPQDAILQSKRTASVQPGVDYDGRTIVLNFPPFVYFFFLYLIAGLLAVFIDYRYYRNYRKKKGGPIYRRYNVKFTGRKFAKVLTIIILVIWTPLNFGKIFTAMDHGVLPYNNLAFVLRQWAEEKGKPLDQADELVTWVKTNAPLPDSWKQKTETVTKFVARARYVKDTFVDTFTWLGDDPILTPSFQWASDKLQSYIVPKDVLMHGDWTVQYYSAFTQPIVPKGTDVSLRNVVDAKGNTNPWGLHGEMCYACTGVKSWLGTDVVIPATTYVQSPVLGVIETVILDGTDDVGGNSIWITAEGVRFALIGVNHDDALRWKVGQNVGVGQQIARPNGPHLHIVMQVRNQNGSWGDYPVVLLMDATGTSYQWFTSQPPFYDKYVPTGDEVTKYSQFILKK
jgi:murein DD-endopeptidase MepM/ murein hydrolase activator NlpD